jgi:pSer/pThr/pTyr-binding forkhead associated (FHA) protein
VEDLAAGLRALAKTLSHDEFVARFAGYYLVVGPLPNEEDPFAFDTRSANVQRMLTGGLVANASLIVALKKSERSPYATLISVGRARNCDVVLRASTVSKLHAQFVVQEGGWQLVDRESANATEVNGRVLPANQPEAVAPGDRLKFGAIECLLADGEALFRALKSA